MLMLGLKTRCVDKRCKTSNHPTLPRTVALFPTRVQARNAESPYLTSAYHDVPWDDPDLLEASVAIARGQRRFNGMMTQQERRREAVRAFLAAGAPPCGLRPALSMGVV